MSAGSRQPTIGRVPAVLVLTAVACGHSTDEHGAWTAEELAMLDEMTFPARPPDSPSNRYADLEAAAELGHELFFDPGFSADGSTSCASCHKPALYFTDGQPTAVGLGEVRRHTPSVLGAVWYPFLTWDGRKDSPWSQALGPLEGAEEMGSHRLLVARRVAAQHAASYERVFGPLPALPPGLETLEAADARDFWGELDESARERVDGVFVRVGKAIEAYERRLRPEPAPFDAYVRALHSGDADGGGHLTVQAVRGLRSFVRGAGCIHCHNGPLLTDMAFHNLGLPPGNGPVDEGRAAGIRALLADEFRSDGPHADDGANPELAFVRDDFSDSAGAFKTPSLRNVARTAPFGHRGQFRSLHELLAFYQQEREAPATGHLDPLLDLVSADFDRADMVAFLETLTAPPPESKWWRAPVRNPGGASPIRGE